MGESPLDKRGWRVELRSRRSAIEGHDQKSELICQHLQKQLESVSLKRVLAYQAYGGEPSLAPLFQWRGEFDWFLPRVEGDGIMQFYRWQLGDPLVANRWGIPEPQPTERLDSPPGVVLIPCLGIDPSGVRLGYGGGFYDRFLSHTKAEQLIGVCFDDQIVAKLPRESHDQLLDGYVTESGFRERTKDPMVKGKE